jgi:(p)ppGpp synthase/HD superfamily hydrolase
VTRFPNKPVLFSRLREKACVAMIFDAIEFAARAHREQFRKGTRIPYIIHPMGVAGILIEYGCAEELVVAGILHDTVEDTAITLADIRKAFGGKVADLVESASEPDKADTWENRKRHTIEYLKTAPPDLLILSCADKLDNIRSIRKDYESFGEAVWDRFRRARESQRWYYRSLADVFMNRAEGEPCVTLCRQFRHEVQQVFPEGNEAGR